MIDSSIIDELRQKCALELQKLHNSGLRSIAGDYASTIIMLLPCCLLFRWFSTGTAVARREAF